MRKRYSPFFKLLTVFLILAFSSEPLVFAAEDLKPLLLSLKGNELKLSFQIPPSIARVEDSYKAPAGSSGKTLYLIQDAHTNESGQRNISKTLDLLFTREKGVRSVYAEGAVGDSSLSYLRPFRPLKERVGLADRYIRKGLLHGAEYLDLTSDHTFTIWGVDDPELYTRSLEAYRAVAKDRERFGIYLKKIQVSYESLGSRFISPALKSLLDDTGRFEDGSLALTDYFDRLSRDSAKFNIGWERFKHLSALKDLKEREAAIDFKKANGEQQKAVEGLSAEDRRLLKEASAQAGPAKHAAENPAAGYFALLKEKLGARSPELGANEYPELFKYFDYLKLAEGLDAPQVLSEIKELESALVDVLALSEDEKSFAAIFRMRRLYDKLFRMALVPSEYDEYLKLKKQFDIERLTGFLNKKIMDSRSDYDRTLLLEPGYEAITASSETFYELTKQRDQKFLEQTLKRMEETGEKQAALVTGGFHTVNLKALLKEKGVSFVSITPQILQETNIRRYEDILLGQKTTETPKLTLSSKAATLAEIYVAPWQAAGSRFTKPETDAKLGIPVEFMGSRVSSKPIKTLPAVVKPLEVSALSGARAAAGDQSPEAMVMSLRTMNDNFWTGLGDDEAERSVLSIADHVEVVRSVIINALHQVHQETAGSDAGDEDGRYSQAEYRATLELAQADQIVVQLVGNAERTAAAQSAYNNGRVTEEKAAILRAELEAVQEDTTAFLKDLKRALKISIISAAAGIEIIRLGREADGGTGARAASNPELDRAEGITANYAHYTRRGVRMDKITKDNLMPLLEEVRAQFEEVRLNNADGKWFTKQQIDAYEKNLAAIARAAIARASKYPGAKSGTDGFYAFRVLFPEDGTASYTVRYKADGDGEVWLDDSLMKDGDAWKALEAAMFFYNEQAQLGIKSKDVTLLHVRQLPRRVFVWQNLSVTFGVLLGVVALLTSSYIEKFFNQTPSTTPTTIITPDTTTTLSSRLKSDLKTALTAALGRSGAKELKPEYRAAFEVFRDALQSGTIAAVVPDPFADPSEIRQPAYLEIKSAPGQSARMSLVLDEEIWQALVDGAEEDFVRHALYSMILNYGTVMLDVEAKQGYYRDFVNLEQRFLAGQLNDEDFKRYTAQQADILAAGFGPQVEYLRENGIDWESVSDFAEAGGSGVSLRLVQNWQLILDNREPEIWETRRSLRADVKTLDFRRGLLQTFWAFRVNQDFQDRLGRIPDRSFLVDEQYVGRELSGARVASTAAPYEVEAAVRYFTGVDKTTPITRPFRASKREDVVDITTLSGSRRLDLIRRALRSLLNAEGYIATLIAGASSRMNPAEAPSDAKALVGGRDILSKAAVPIGKAPDGQVTTYLGEFLTNLSRFFTAINEEASRANVQGDAFKNEVGLMTNDQYQPEHDALLAQNSDFGIPHDRLRMFLQPLGAKFIATPADAVKAKAGLETRSDKAYEEALALSNQVAADIATRPEAVILEGERDPLGQGEFFHQLIASGEILHIHGSGKKWIFAKNIDNYASKFDETFLVILGLFLEQGLDFQPEVSPRSPGQKGGSLIIMEDNGAHQLAEDPNIDATNKDRESRDEPPVMKPADSYWFNDAVGLASVSYVINPYKLDGQSDEEFFAELRKASLEERQLIADRGRRKFPKIFDTKPAKRKNAAVVKGETNMWQSTGVVSPDMKIKSVGVKGIRNIPIEEYKTLSWEAKKRLLAPMRFFSTKNWTKSPKEVEEARAQLEQQLGRPVTDGEVWVTLETYQGNKIIADDLLRYNREAELVPHGILSGARAAGSQKEALAELRSAYAVLSDTRNVPAYTTEAGPRLFVTTRLNDFLPGARMAQNKKDIKHAADQLRVVIERLKEGSDDKRTAEITLEKLEKGEVELFYDEMAIYDENWSEIGALDIGVGLVAGLKHRTVDILPVLPDGDFIIQQRTHNAVEPNTYSLTGGYVLPGETLEKAALRVLQEELGVLSFRGGILEPSAIIASEVFSASHNKQRGFFTYYFSRRETQDVRNYASELQHGMSIRRPEQYLRYIEDIQRQRNGGGKIQDIVFLKRSQLLQVGKPGNPLILEKAYFSVTERVVAEPSSDTLLPFLLVADIGEKLEAIQSRADEIQRSTGARAAEDTAVTGAPGFLSKYLWRLLEVSGANTKLLVRPGSLYRVGKTGENIAVVTGDLSDTAALDELVADAGVVFDLATHGHANKTQKDPAGSLKVALGKARLMRAVEGKSVRIVIHASSESVDELLPFLEAGSETDRWLTEAEQAFRVRAEDAATAQTDGEFAGRYLEDHPVPAALKNKVYGLFKLLEERLVRNATSGKGLSVRLPMMYGEGDYISDSRISKIIRLYNFNEPIGYPLYKGQSRRVLFAEDAARILLALGSLKTLPEAIRETRLLDVKPPAQVDGQLVGAATNSQVVDLLKKITYTDPEKIDPKFTYGVPPAGFSSPPEGRTFTPQVTDLLSELGLKGFRWTPLEDGLRKTMSARKRLQEVSSKLGKSRDERRKLVTSLAKDLPLLVPKVAVDNPGHKGDDLPAGNDDGIPTLFITGAASNMMNMVATYFAETHPAYRLVLADNFTVGSEEALVDLLAHPRFAGRIIVVKGDIRDADFIRYWMRRSDAVLHGAAESNVERSDVQKELFYETNVLGTLNIAMAVLEENKRRESRKGHPIRMLPVITDEVYGGSMNHYIRENEKYNPTNWYARTKLYALLGIRYLNGELSMEEVRAVYGEGADEDDRRFLKFLDGLNVADEDRILGAMTVFPTNNVGTKKVMNFMQNAVVFHLLGLPMPIFGEKMRKRDFMHAVDFARALDLILHEGRPGEGYNMTARNPVTLLQAALTTHGEIDGNERITEEEAFRSGRMAVMKENRDENDPQYLVNNAKIRLLGFRPVIQFDEGVELMVKWIIRHPEWLISQITAPEFDEYLGRLFRDYPGVLALTRMRIAEFAKTNGRARFKRLRPRPHMSLNDPKEFADYYEKWAAGQAGTEKETGMVRRLLGSLSKANWVADALEIVARKLQDDIDNDRLPSTVAGPNGPHTVVKDWPATVESLNETARRFRGGEIRTFDDISIARAGILKEEQDLKRFKPGLAGELWKLNRDIESMMHYGRRTASGARAAGRDSAEQALVLVRQILQEDVDRTGWVVREVMEKTEKELKRALMQAGPTDLTFIRDYITRALPGASLASERLRQIVGKIPDQIEGLAYPGVLKGDKRVILIAYDMEGDLENRLDELNVALSEDTGRLADFQVVLAENAEDAAGALEAFQSRISVFITERSLPDIRGASVSSIDAYENAGQELVRQARKIRSDLPIIIIGMDQEEVNRLGEETGAFLSYDRTEAPATLVHALRAAIFGARAAEADGARPAATATDDEVLNDPEVQGFLAQALRAQRSVLNSPDDTVEAAILLAGEALKVFSIRLSHAGEEDEKLVVSLRGGSATVLVNFRSVTITDAGIPGEVTSAAISPTDFPQVLKQLVFSEGLALSGLAEIVSPVIEQYDLPVFGSDIRRDPTNLDLFLFQAYAAERRPGGKNIYYRFSRPGAAAVQERIKAAEESYPKIAAALRTIMARQAPKDAPVVHVKKLGSRFKPKKDHYVIFMRAPNRAKGELMAYPVELGAASVRTKPKKGQAVDEHVRNAFGIRLGKDPDPFRLAQSLLGLGDEDINQEFSLGPIGVKIMAYIQGARAAIRYLAAAA